MKRLLILPGILFLLLAGLWFGYGARPVPAAYVVTEEPGAGAALSLVVERPGLFVDLVVPQGDLLQGVTLFKPWQGARRLRVLTWWQRPFALTLARGEGPFRLAGLPRPAAGAQPELQLPAGWQQAGNWAGRFELVQGGAVSVAVPAGMGGAPEAIARVNQLFAAATAMLGEKPLAGTAVLVSADPINLSRSVVDLWMPAYADDASWWADGAADFYTMKLLDQTGLWTGHEKDEWTERKFREKGFVLVLWLDAALKLSTGNKQALDTVFRAAQHARTNADVLRAVREAGGIAPADHLDRMLRGREPLPSSAL